MSTLPVFLVGYMGCGKTTLGYSLSKYMKRDFIDLDIFIEARFRCSVRDLFQTRGEVKFREIEQSILHEVGEFENVIVACGGGTPCFFDNMDFMNSHGITVFLQASVERIFSRLTIPSARAKRPLIAGKTDDELREFIVSALSARDPFYTKSQIVFNSDKLESRSEVNESTIGLAQILEKL